MSSGSGGWWWVRGQRARSWARESVTRRYTPFHAVTAVPCRSMPFHAVPCRYLPLQAKPRPSDLRAFAKGQPEEAREGSESQPWVLEWLRWSSTRKQLRELEEAQGKSLGKATTELRRSLHLNVAAAALKQADHELAAGACQFVLRRSPEHPKALYRLAAAQRGGASL